MKARKYKKNARNSFFILKAVGGQEFWGGTMYYEL